MMNTSAVTEFEVERGTDRILGHLPLRVQRPAPHLSEGMHGIAVLIPAWQPDEKLSSLLTELLLEGFGAIVLVDDGSRLETAPIFLRAKKLAGVHVLRHARNLGKGRALKTGLNFVATELVHIRGVVTADADGQHCAPDVIRVAKALITSHGTPVFGVRQFQRDVPLRSRVGNTLTRYVFWLLAGSRVSDTQTGLRGFPMAFVPSILSLDGEGYEYEMNVLAHLCQELGPPVELPIATVYLEMNRSSHFHPIRDSMRIYFVLLRFYAASFFGD